MQVQLQDSNPRIYMHHHLLPFNFLPFALYVRDKLALITEKYPAVTLMDDGLFKDDY